MGFFVYSKISSDQVQVNVDVASHLDQSGQLKERWQLISKDDGWDQRVKEKDGDSLRKLKGMQSCQVKASKIIIL